ncbi:unnamed protein product, partial [Candidula unifasciata]
SLITVLFCNINTMSYTLRVDYLIKDRVKYHHLTDVIINYKHITEDRVKYHHLTDSSVNYHQVTES